MSEPSQTAPLSREQKPFFHCAIAVIVNDKGEVLLGQRPADKPWAGWWEFPGGKLEVGETVQDALIRELKEELDICITESRPWVTFHYEYPSTRVLLEFCRVTAWHGEPKGLENQQFAWTLPQHAEQLGQLLPASVAPLRWLQLPDYYAVTPAFAYEQREAFMQQLHVLISKGIRMLQFRQAQWPQGPKAANLKEIFDEVLAYCRQHQVKLLVNSAHPKSWWQLADGVQLRSNDALLLEQRPLEHDKWVAVSAHNLADLLYAQVLQADFCVLGHVQATPSHPHSAALGWPQFHEWATQAACPVYAIGGLGSQDLALAHKNGAHGIAAIRALWPD
ncbi:Nudix family hydrolase [Brackiella oedipodis]|uniref:Nudix family hydrolase n=1 Tax=Brackiella oedipodis TaxID=124225 RepID=UPI0009FF081E|nr:Nudix family hydrolase [Brackiella oedipodis]